MIRTAPVLLLTVACAAKEIDDPQLQQSGLAAGEQSSAMASEPAEAEESTMQSHATGLSSTFQAAVGRFQATAVASRVATGPVFAEGDSTYSWDGTNLVLVFSAGDETSLYTYDFALDLTIGGTEGEVTLDGTYALDWSAGVSGISVDYTIDAVYDGMVLTDGCASGGALDISFDQASDLGGLGGLGDLGDLGGATSGAMRFEYGPDCAVTVFER